MRCTLELLAKQTRSEDLELGDHISPMTIRVKCLLHFLSTSESAQSTSSCGSDVSISLSLHLLGQITWAIHTFCQLHPGFYRRIFWLRTVPFLLHCIEIWIYFLDIFSKWHKSGHIPLLLHASHSTFPDGHLEACWHSEQVQCLFILTKAFPSLFASHEIKNLFVSPSYPDVTFIALTVSMYFGRLWNFRIFLALWISLPISHIISRTLFILIWYHCLYHLCLTNGRATMIWACFPNNIHF